jgi:general secretion pathway protein D
MRWWPAGPCLFLAGICLTADGQSSRMQRLCSDTAVAPACHGGAKDLKLARQAFARGVELEQSRPQTLQHLNQAYYEFQRASRLVPQNVEYQTALDLSRQRLAAMHVELGRSDLLDGRQAEASEEFRTALNFDPQNEFVQQRMHDALRPSPVPVANPPEVVASSDALTLKPIDGPRDFHYRGDSRGLLTAVAESYGLTEVFDDSFVGRPVRFDIERADFSTAMQAASEVTMSFSVALDSTIIFSCADSKENHRLFDHMGMRSFYIPGEGDPQELQDVMNSLRTIFDFQIVSLNTASSTITIRGPQAALASATQFLGQLRGVRPEVLLDLQVFQIDHTYARTIGLHVPNNFNLYNIPAALSTSSGSSLAALVAQLESGSTSILSQPLATFGGGITLMGLSLDQISAALSLNESWVRLLNHAQLRAQEQDNTTFRMGSRYPIMTSSYSSILGSVSASTLQALGISSSTAAALSSASSSTIPSITYQDLGLTLKVKPQVHGNSSLALELEIQLQTLGATTVNGIPIIENCQYKGTIMLKEGETAVAAKMITKSDQRSLSGLPLFSTTPAVGALTSQRTNQEEDDELLILITPYVLRSAERTDTPTIWLRR